MAIIRFARDFLESPPESQRHTICHELLYVHTHRMMAAVADLEPIVGAVAFKVFWDRFMQELEYSVDGLADVLGPRLPLNTGTSW